MEVLLLFIIIIGSGYLFTYIIDTFKGETKLCKKIQQKKITEGISQKLRSGEELSWEEKMIIKENLQIYNLENDLLKRNINDKVEKENE